MLNRIWKIITNIQYFLSGKKTYLAGSIIILQGISCLIEDINGWKGFSDVIMFIKHFSDHKCITQLAEGLGVIGFRSALTKNSNNSEVKL